MLAASLAVPFLMRESDHIIMVCNSIGGSRFVKMHVCLQGVAVI